MEGGFRGVGNSVLQFCGEAPPRWRQRFYPNSPTSPSTAHQPTRPHQTAPTNSQQSEDVLARAPNLEAAAATLLALTLAAQFWLRELGGGAAGGGGGDGLLDAVDLDAASTLIDVILGLFSGLF